MSEDENEEQYGTYTVGHTENSASLTVPGEAEEADDEVQEDE